MSNIATSGVFSPLRVNNLVTHKKMRPSIIARICDDVDDIHHNEDSYIVTGACVTYKQVLGNSVFVFKSMKTPCDMVISPPWSKRPYMVGGKTLYALHSGFMKQALALIDFVKQRVIHTNPSRVFLCGYSLGGAVAVIVGAWLAQSFPSRFFHTVTFGSPCMGDKRFQKHCSYLTNLDSIRFQNQYDIVPYFPFFGYYHVGCLHKVISNTCFCCLHVHHRMSTYASHFAPGGLH